MTATRVLQPNIDLLHRTRDHIAANPDAWDQSTWHCGSAACYAGHAALLAGAHWANPDAGEADDTELESMVVIRPDGVEEKDVANYAERVLGLTDTQASRLFSGGNNLADIDAEIERIIAQARFSREVEEWPVPAGGADLDSFAQEDWYERADAWIEDHAVTPTGRMLAVAARP